MKLVYNRQNTTTTNYQLTFLFLASLSALLSSRKLITLTLEAAAATCIPVFP